MAKSRGGRQERREGLGSTMKNKKEEKRTSHKEV